MKQLIDRMLLHIARWYEKRSCAIAKRSLKNSIFYALCREKMPGFIKAMHDGHGAIILVVVGLHGRGQVLAPLVYMHSTDCPVYVKRNMFIDGEDALDACLDAVKYDDICCKVPTHLKPMIGLAYVTFIKQGTTFEELAVEYDLKHV